MTNPTYKVTYFDSEMTVQSVQTYHGVNGGDGVVCEWIFNHMLAYGCIAVQFLKSYDNNDYRNLTAAFYGLYADRIAEITNDILN